MIKLKKTLFWVKIVLRAWPKSLQRRAGWRDLPVIWLEVMANSDVDEGAAPDLSAGGRGLSKRPAGMGAARANDPAGPDRRTTAQDRMPAAMEAIPYLLRTPLPLALSAALRVSATLDDVQHLSQVLACWRPGGDLGWAAHRGARADGTRAQPVGHGSRQDCDEAGLVLDKIRRRFPWLELIWADGGYNAWQVEAAVAKVPRLCLATGVKPLGWTHQSGGWPLLGQPDDPC
jgi:hypothetical protein